MPTGLSTMELTTDPEGRLGVGMIVRQSGTTNPAAYMEVMGFTEPSGLYRRPVRDGDPTWYHLDMIPCDPSDEGAVYDPEALIACIRYVDHVLAPGYTYQTTIRAVDVEPVT